MEFVATRAGVYFIVLKIRIFHEKEVLSMRAVESPWLEDNIHLICNPSFHLQHLRQLLHIKNWTIAIGEGFCFYLLFSQRHLFDHCKEVEYKKTSDCMV